SLHGEVVRVTVWPDGDYDAAARPDATWVGKWISTVGLMQPPVRRHGRTKPELVVYVTEATQSHIISDDEATFRFGGATVQRAASRPHNRAILDAMHAARHAPTAAQTPAAVRMVGSVGASTTPVANAPQRTRTRKFVAAGPCYIATAIYGDDALET